jgi:hypothetical protein
MRKERDYHRMHHNRVVQEKNKLITDLKRMKLHYDTYEPLLKTMKEKYDLTMRDKVVNQLERDKAVAELNQMKNVPNTPSTKFLRFLPGLALGQTQSDLFWSYV